MRKTLRNILLAILIFTIAIPTSISMFPLNVEAAEASIGWVDNPAGSGHYPGSVDSSKSGWRCYIATEEGVIRSKVIDFVYGNLPSGAIAKSYGTRLGGRASMQEYNPPWPAPLSNGSSNAGTVKAKMKAKTGKSGGAFVCDVIERYFGKGDINGNGKDDAVDEFISEQEYFVMEPVYWGYLYKGNRRTNVQLYGTSQFFSKTLIRLGFPEMGDTIQKSWTNGKMGQCFKLEPNKDGLFGLSVYPDSPYQYSNSQGCMGYGLGIGVLWAGDLDETEELQTTCDESQQPTEHRAPQESSGSYRIIKFYEEQESDGAIQPLVNYTRKGVTNKIQVENETDWELIKWDKSTNYYGKKGSGLENEILNALSSYDEVVGACGSTGGGAGTSLVTLTEKVDTTL